MAKWNLKGWIQKWLPGAKAKGKEVSQEYTKEFWSQVRKMIVGAFIALLLVLLGFPRLSAWYENYKEKRMNPERQVYVQCQVKEAYKLEPLDSVYVQIWGDASAIGYTNDNGIVVIEYQAETGENTVNLTLKKEGYLEGVERDYALPQEDGDSTILRTLQLFPIAPKEEPKAIEPAFF